MIIFNLANKARLISVELKRQAVEFSANPELIVPEKIDMPSSAYGGVDDVETRFINQGNASDTRFNHYGIRN